MIDEINKLVVDPSSPNSGGASVLRSASDTAISTVVGAWELSVANAGASKEKRIKDVKNTSLKQQNIKKRITIKADGTTVSEVKLDGELRVTCSVFR